MRRLSALIMLFGACTAAVGVVAVVGVERMNLPPSALRVIEAAIPVTVLVIGVALLLVGTLMARLSMREAERRVPSGTGMSDARAVGERAASVLPTPPARGAADPRPVVRDRAT
jgi:hypothetical protein